MATILFSAAGAAIGSSVGGTILGLSATAAGRFVGGVVGRSIDQALLGAGSDPVEHGRVDRLRLSGSGEGDPIPRLHGRVRVGGHVIWATEFSEVVTTSGGKGVSSSPRTRDYSYSVSLAIAVCEGEITSVSRVWADGVEISPNALNMRVYPGSADQMPDPKMEAVEGAGVVPAYRGTAYVVFEDLELGAYGNRVPQFSFEVTRPGHAGETPFGSDIAHRISGVAMLPGSGEYALATEQIKFDQGLGKSSIVNVNSPTGQVDFEASLGSLEEELPNCGAVSLIVSWFGDDLRCGNCTIRPKVEQRELDGSQPWLVSGLARKDAVVIAQVDGRPIYGGTPTDQSVIQAIEKLNGAGQDVMYYPFILMDQLEGNGLTDPWSDADDQPALPWRGRITTSKAPGQPGSPDTTATADAEVASFFGTATARDFGVSPGSVSYTGPGEWSYRRFILHQAALCAAAGGVTAFCIGSEMRSLTPIRGESGFPAVAELKRLAFEVRQILGAECKIGYAADWSEYFGYQPQDGSGDLYFHLDPLWSDDEIDFVGIDNYMPLSDWRDGSDHADMNWGAIYDPGYLASNIEGGEGFDWYYHSADARVAQIRTPITDETHDEPWVWRYKDIRSWWSNVHHERIGGVRQNNHTDWLPESKPVWFTELGCAAINKGSNQPNKFLDPKSSESALPHYSNGQRDELMQMQYLKAVLRYWSDPLKNPVSREYGREMIDTTRIFVWAWDARPYPWFPGNRSVWSDGDNYTRGHWITGRVSGRSLASVVAEICEQAGLRDYDVSALWGYVRGFVIGGVETARASLQPLMLRYGFDAVERDGKLVFVMRDGDVDARLDADNLAISPDLNGIYEVRRGGEAELSGRVRLKYCEADGDHDLISEEAILANEATHAVAASELPLVMTRSEGRQTVERWLAEARIARETVRFSLPLSRLDVSPGDVVSVDGADGPERLRVDRVELGMQQLIEAVRIENETYDPVELVEDLAHTRSFTPTVPVYPLFMDLPLIRGMESPHAPHLALTAEPWPGSVAVYDSHADEGYLLNGIHAVRSVIGETETALIRAQAGLIDRGDALQVRLASGALQSVERLSMLGGRNLAAIGDGSSGNWELIQFEAAELVKEDTYLIRNRLRGQGGTDGVMPDVWPVGSLFVVLDGTTRQIAQDIAHRGLARHYRIGPARRGYDDPSYVHRIEAFDGIGLRPYAPCHLRAAPLAGGFALNWLRRTRIDGDSWASFDVPLGEESETYLVQVTQGGSVLRETRTTASTWAYTAEMMADDRLEGAFDVAVSQVSTTFGPGPAAHLALNV